LKQHDTSLALISYHLDVGESGFLFAEKFSTVFGPAVLAFTIQFNVCPGAFFCIGQETAL
jgi:hypothetical protein